MNHFITSMLELTKIESKAIRIHLESKDINQLIEKAILSLEPQAQAKGIRINLNLEPLFPIKLDGHLILKVIINLIDNAIKYSPNQSEILVESIETDEHVVVSVSDHGIGLTETEKEQLFTRFYRAKNDLTTRTPGTGSVSYTHLTLPTSG